MACFKVARPSCDVTEQWTTAGTWGDSPWSGTKVQSSTDCAMPRMQQSCIVPDCLWIFCDRSNWGVWHSETCLLVEQKWAQRLPFFFFSIPREMYQEGSDGFEKAQCNLISILFYARLFPLCWSLVIKHDITWWNSVTQCYSWWFFFLSRVVVLHHGSVSWLFLLKAKGSFQNFFFFFEVSNEFTPDVFS